MASWVRTITTPFRKARTLFNPTRDQKKSSSQQGGHGDEDDKRVVIDHLHGEVMACGYEDVQVMWSMMLHKSSNLTAISCN